MVVLKSKFVATGVYTGKFKSAIQRGAVAIKSVL